MTSQPSRLALLLDLNGLEAAHLAAVISRSIGGDYMPSGRPRSFGQRPRRCSDICVRSPVAPMLAVGANVRLAAG
jgi:hypothetical protein